jgi:hypothetical protein
MTANGSSQLQTGLGFSSTYRRDSARSNVSLGRRTYMTLPTMGLVFVMSILTQTVEPIPLDPK